MLYSKKIEKFEETRDNVRSLVNKYSPVSLRELLDLYGNQVYSMTKVCVCLPTNSYCFWNKSLQYFLNSIKLKYTPKFPAKPTLLKRLKASAPKRFFFRRLQSAMVNIVKEAGYGIHLTFMVYKMMNEE